jgi:hypothetical protein
LIERATKYVEDNFLPPSSAAAGKKKVVRFPAA